MSFLGQAIGDLDTLTTEAERTIELLVERRSALISAAVTGQIDVRGIAPEKPAKEIVPNLSALRLRAS